MKYHLDHNASTAADPRVLKRFLEVEAECPGNPGSLHGTGRRARAVLEDSRRQLARALDVPPGDVFFLSGGTEANNLAVLGSGDPGLPVALGPAEHPSVWEPAQTRGVVLLAVASDGQVVIPEDLPPVGLLCLVHGQNEVGTLQPVGEAADLSQRLHVPLHVDAAQTLGRVSLQLPLSVADSVSLSLHKAGGLRGSGVLVARDGGQGLRPLLRGGGQEHGLRPGTPSPALAAAAALTLELAVGECGARAARMAAARGAFLDELTGSGVAHTVLTPLARSLPNTILVHFHRVDGRALLPALDLAGVEASQGSACSSGSPMPPRILAAMGLPEDDARACVRFSFAHDHDVESAARAGELTVRTMLHLQQRAQR